MKGKSTSLLKTGAVLLFLLTAVAGFSQVIDLRTKLEEKLELSPIKNGAVYYLFDAGFTVLEISEDYAVWLKNYSRFVSVDGRVEISFTVTLSPPTTVYEKHPFVEKRVSFSYNPGKPETMTTDESAAQFIRKKIVRLSKQVEAEAIMGGQLVRNTVIELLEELTV